MDQHEWVAGCQRYYEENWLEPGNPDDGEWHDCHYPTPQCLGGTETVKLLKEHHAVQGVLQSEEYQHCCVWSWEQDYLSGELLTLCRLWMGRRGFNSYPPEERSRRAKVRADRETPEQRSERARRINASIPPEQRSAIARARRASQMAKMTPEQKSEAARKGNANRSAESKQKARENVRKARENRWRCLVTGHETNAGALALYQRARGIDPSNRERVV